MDFYECDADIYADPGFPVYFSGSTLHREVDSGYRYLHWHEAVEILYCIEGEGVAVSDALSIPLAAGEIAVIGGNRLHTFYTEDVCRYAYLLVGSELSASRDLPGVRVQPFISDPEAERQLRGILRELREQAPFYRSEVCARLTRFFVYLCRNYPESESASEQSCAGKRLEMVKAVIAYVSRHFAEPITVDDICGAVSFSRSYVCHTFKEVTGLSLVEYIQFVRCRNARTLLASKQYNVSECAEKSGFNTLSYFSRIYKKQMGVPPSVHR